MSGIPDYINLCGDEDGGVTAVCEHPECAGSPGFGIAYYSGGGPDARNPVPYFKTRQAGDLFDFLRAHARAHTGDS